MPITYAARRPVGKRKIEAPSIQPTQFELEADELEHRLFGPVEFASGLPTDFLEGRWP
jgi:hypothetical protein